MLLNAIVLEVLTIAFSNIDVSLLNSSDINCPLYSLHRVCNYHESEQFVPLIELLFICCLIKLTKHMT